MQNILVVDDDPMIRAFLRAHLSSLSGYAVTCASDSREALALIEKMPELALLVTDVIMPEIDGIDLIRAAKHRQPPPLILAISAGGRYCTALYLDNAELFGANSTLVKPFTGWELMAAAGKLLNASECAPASPG